MTISKNDGRQAPIVAWVDFNLADVADGTAQAAIELPGGAILLSGELIVSEAFNAGTTAVLDVGDALSANRYANDLDLKTLGRKPLVPTGYVMPHQGDLTVTYVPAGTAATTGKARLIVEYIDEGRVCFTQG